VVARNVAPMNLSMGGIVIDCLEPRQLADFWTKALGLEVAFDADGVFLALRAPGDTGMYLGLQKVPEEKVGKNRVHLDLATDNMDDEVARLAGLGATVGEKHEVPGLAWTILRDPVGNEFCVGTHTGQ
jgi:predicted enzyme related to lactoylglutathione lyase